MLERTLKKDMEQLDENVNKIYFKIIELNDKQKLFKINEQIYLLLKKIEDLEFNLNHSETLNHKEKYLTQITLNKLTLLEGLKIILETQIKSDSSTKQNFVLQKSELVREEIEDCEKLLKSIKFGYFREIEYDDRCINGGQKVSAPNIYSLIKKLKIKVDKIHNNYISYCKEITKKLNERVETKRIGYNPPPINQIERPKTPTPNPPPKREK